MPNYVISFKTVALVLNHLQTTFSYLKKVMGHAMVYNKLWFNV